jgi:hypothetical protein
MIGKQIIARLYNHASSFRTTASIFKRQGVRLFSIIPKENAEENRNLNEILDEMIDNKQVLKKEIESKYAVFSQILKHKASFESEAVSSKKLNLLMKGYFENQLLSLPQADKMLLFALNFLPENNKAIPGKILKEFLDSQDFWTMTTIDNRLKIFLHLLNHSEHEFTVTVVERFVTILNDSMRTFYSDISGTLALRILSSYLQIKQILEKEHKTSLASLGAMTVALFDIVKDMQAISLDNYGIEELVTMLTICSLMKDSSDRGAKLVEELASRLTKASETPVVISLEQLVQVGALLT